MPEGELVSEEFLVQQTDFCQEEVVKWSYRRGTSLIAEKLYFTTDRLLGWVSNSGKHRSRASADTAHRSAASAPDSASTSFSVGNRGLNGESKADRIAVAY